MNLITAIKAAWLRWAYRNSAVIPLPARPVLRISPRQGHEVLCDPSL